jgi:hypothetical protein
MTANSKKTKARKIEIEVKELQSRSQPVLSAKSYFPGVAVDGDGGD